MEPEKIYQILYRSSSEVCWTVYDIEFTKKKADYLANNLKKSLPSWEVKILCIE